MFRLVLENTSDTNELMEDEVSKKVQKNDEIKGGLTNGKDKTHGKERLIITRMLIRSTIKLIFRLQQMIH